MLQLGNVLLDEFVALARKQVPHSLVRCHVLGMFLFLWHKVTYGRYEHEPR